MAPPPPADTTFRTTVLGGNGPRDPMPAGKSSTFTLNACSPQNSVKAPRIVESVGLGRRVLQFPGGIVNAVPIEPVTMAGVTWGENAEDWVTLARTSKASFSGN